MFQHHLPDLPPLREVNFSLCPRLGFHLNWLREPAPLQIRADLGLALDTGAEAALELTLEGSFTCTLRPDSDNWVHLLVFLGGPNPRIRVSAQAPQHEAARKLAEAIAGLEGPAGDVVEELARRISRQVAPALEKTFSAELGCLVEAAASESALLDVSFAPTPEGEAALREALAGNFTPALAGGPYVRLCHAVLSHGLSREARLEVHLPFLDRKQWLRRWEALAHTGVEASDDGRLLVHAVEGKNHLQKRRSYQSTLALSGGLLHAAAGTTPSGFTLGYTDRRRLSHWTENLDVVLRAYGLAGEVKTWLEAHRAALGDDLEVSLCLSVPGELVWAWLDAPGQRDPEFFAAYSAVSVAVQRALRRWLPYAYFSDPNRYDDPLAAWPLLVYEAMPPFPGKPKYEFTYDVMDLGATSLIRRSTLRELAARLARLRPFLIALGKKKTARFFAPDEAPAILATVARQPRLLNALLSAETFFVEALVDLGLHGHAFTESAARNPAQAAKDLSRFADQFTTAFHRRLRRLYGGQDFGSFGTLLLIEATRALAASRGCEAPLSAVVRLSAGELEQSFVSVTCRT